MQPDVVLIGAGIMSATLAVLLHELEPEWNLQVFERLDQAAQESSDAWNNAGTGHSAFCELNYTPERPDGSIDVSKALTIAAQFEVSKEFWASLVEHGRVSDPSRFIRQVPHLSFVRGEENCDFLERRHALLKEHALFEGMELTSSHETLRRWVPLMMEDRPPKEPLAATRMDIGTDVDFGALATGMYSSLAESGRFELHCRHEIRDIDPRPDGQWDIFLQDLKSAERRHVRAPFVFIGAGGGTLRLLERSDIPEARGYGGFPVSGQWLVCENPALVERHHAKVYGKAAVGSPPMSVPHLDTRVIAGARSLFFGPYAGFSTRFLKQGSLLDLPGSLRFGNVRPMISAGLHNLDLARYLLDQVTQTHEERVATLREFVPTARARDWRLEVAGQRVQVIKKHAELGGVLEFGTELVVSGQRTLTGLLGASPGASTAVSIMLELLERCFPDRLPTARWQDTLRRLIPSYGRSLEEPALVLATRRRSQRLLGLDR